MAKKRTKKVEPVEEFEELEEIDSSIDEDEDDDDDGLTYTKRFTVSYFQPEKSYGGSRCYKDFYETNTLADAKKEGQKALEERKVEIMICDRDNLCLEPLYLQPEVKEEEDDSTTTESKTSSRAVRGSSKGSSTGTKPKPKHPRRKTTTTRRKS